jgi:hypothetical protein
MFRFEAVVITVVDNVPKATAYRKFKDWMSIENWVNNFNKDCDFTSPVYEYAYPRPCVS